MLLFRDSSQYHFYGCALTRQFEALKVYCLNSAAITQFRDKLYSLQLYYIAVWDSYNRFCKLSVRYQWFDKKWWTTIIVKKLLRNSRKRSCSCWNKKSGGKCYQCFQSLNANILVQEFIKEGTVKIYDFCNWWESGSYHSTWSNAGEFRANIHLGGTASIIKPTAEEKRIAIKAKSNGFKSSRCRYYSFF
jgi:ribosomal protein S6--L-glutamate ligase